MKPEGRRERLLQPLSPLLLQVQAASVSPASGWSFFDSSVLPSPGPETPAFLHLGYVPSPLVPHSSNPPLFHLRTVAVPYATGLGLGPYPRPRRCSTLARGGMTKRLVPGLRPSQAGRCFRAQPKPPLHQRRKPVQALESVSRLTHAP